MIYTYILHQSGYKVLNHYATIDRENQIEYNEDTNKSRISKTLKRPIRKVVLFNKTQNKMFDRNNDRGFAPRQMVKGNWKCSECGVEITELPFEPAPDRPIYCRECWSKKRPPRQNRY